MKLRGVPVILVAVTAAAAIWGGFRLIKSTTTVLASDASPVPTARVVRGPLDLAAYGTGELRAMRTMVLTAPVVGSTLRLVQMPATGDAVHMGDVIIEFDPTEQQYLLEQAQSELAEADQTVVKMRADIEVQASQDQVTLLGARFDVRRAQMNAVPLPGLLAANEVERNRLSLEEARRRLVQVDDDVKSRVETAKSQLAVVVERRARVKINADRAEMAIQSLSVVAPMDGLIVARENRDVAGGMFAPGFALPEYRAGDNVGPGRPLADIFDVAQIEIRSRVNEEERTNIAVGQPATVFANTLPGVVLAAKVMTIAGLAARSNESSSPVREFDMTLQLDHPDERLRPGTSVRLIVQGLHIENVLHVPRQAVFEKNGKSIVYVRTAGRFEPRDVKIVQRTESRAVLEGLTEGTEVALLNPEIAARMAPSKSSAPSPAPR
jgi:HlyD family secretion protein